jgi:multiple antibiotic resistance protein
MGTGVRDFVGALILAFASLFPVVNPLGDAPIFLSFTQQYPQSTQRLLAYRVGAYGFGLLAASLVFGSEILAFFGVTLAMVQIAGGLVLGSTGWYLLNRPDDTAADTRGPETLQDALQHAFYPLTLPLTVGPGSISIAIGLGAHMRYQAGPGFEHGYPLRFLGALMGMALVCLVVGLCYGNAERLVQRLGRSGTDIVIRLSAFIVLAIGDRAKIEDEMKKLNLGKIEIRDTDGKVLQ